MTRLSCTRPAVGAALLTYVSRAWHGFGFHDYLPCTRVCARFTSVVPYGPAMTYVEMHFLMHFLLFSANAVRPERGVAGKWKEYLRSAAVPVRSR